MAGTIQIPPFNSATVLVCVSSQKDPTNSIFNHNEHTHSHILCQAHQYHWRLYTPILRAFRQCLGCQMWGSFARRGRCTMHLWWLRRCPLHVASKTRTSLYIFRMISAFLLWQVHYFHAPIVGLVINAMGWLSHGLSLCDVDNIIGNLWWWCRIWVV